MIASAPLWFASEAARATGGRTVEGWSATGVAIDSRTVAPGDLFVALVGPRFDGHAFVADALGKGAAAAMVAVIPEGLPADAPLLLVDDTLHALEDLGRAARARCGARIVGVTGSVGKTGTKEALRVALGGQGSVVASAGSFNNHWGVPLSLARMPESAAFGIFEMGMNHAGEIEPLSRMVRPHVAVITTIEAVHVEHFDSVDGIADAKAEIFAGVEPGGAAVLNRDNAYFDRLAAAARSAGIERIIGFGAHADAEVRLVDADLDAEGARVHALVRGRPLAYGLQVAGRHWAINSLAVLAAVAGAGADVEAAAAALADFRVPSGRGGRITVPLPGGAFELIDDSYNANPASVAASIGVLGGIEPAIGGRRIAVLGDMLELGDDGPALHTALAKPLTDHRIDLTFTAGPLMEHLFEALPSAMRGGHAADSTTLAPLVAAAVRRGDVVTVKGSAGSRMGLVVDALRALAANDDAPARAVNGE